MKWVLRLVGLLIVLAIIAVAGVWIMIDPIAKGSIEEGGTRALEVDTTVNDLSLSLVNGTLMIDDLVVANPADRGYETPHLIKSGKFDVGLKPKTVFSDVIELTHFTIDGMDVNLEARIDTTHGPRSNVSGVLKTAQKFQGKPDGEKAPEGEEGTRIKVDTITIRNVKIHATGGVGSSSTGATLEIPELVMENVTPEEAKGILISDLIARITEKVLVAVGAKSAKEGIGTPGLDVQNPGGVLDRLRGGSSDSGDSGDSGDGDDAGSAAGNLLEGAGNLLNRGGD